MFSEHTGLDVWDDNEALQVKGSYHYLIPTATPDLMVATSRLIENKEEVSQENFNQLLKEWEMQKQTSGVMNCDYAYTKNLTTEQYETLGDALVKAGFEGEYPNRQYHFEDDYNWVFGVNNKNENWHGEDDSALFQNGRELSFEQFMQKLKSHSEEALIPAIGSSIAVNINSTEAPTSSSEMSLVQRITLAHKAAQNACQEAVEAYNKYKEAVDELKGEVGDGFKIEAVKWEDLFYTPVGCNMKDWRNWKVGDIVACIGENDEFEIGDLGVITQLEEDDYDGDIPVEVDNKWPSNYRDELDIEDIFKWVKRPQ